MRLRVGVGSSRVGARVCVRVHVRAWRVCVCACVYVRACARVVCVRVGGPCVLTGCLAPCNVWGCRV